VRELPSDRTRTTRFIETFPRPSFRSWPNAYSEAGPVGNRGWSGSKKSPCPRNVAGWRPRRKHAWHPLVRSLPPSVVDAHLQLLWRHGRQRLAARTWCRPPRRRWLGATLEPREGPSSPDCSHWMHDIKLPVFLVCLDASFVRKRLGSTIPRGMLQGMEPNMIRRNGCNLIVRGRKGRLNLKLTPQFR